MYKMGQLRGLEGGSSKFGVQVEQSAWMQIFWFKVVMQNKVYTFFFSLDGKG